jgi:hypothetical protein
MTAGSGYEGVASMHRHDDQTEGQPVAQLTIELVDIPFGREIGSAIAHCARIARRTWRVAADLPNSRHAY